MVQTRPGPTSPARLLADCFASPRWQGRPAYALLAGALPMQSDRCVPLSVRPLPSSSASSSASAGSLQTFLETHHHCSLEHAEVLDTVFNQTLQQISIQDDACRQSRVWRVVRVSRALFRTLQASPVVAGNDFWKIFGDFPCLILVAIYSLPTPRAPKCKTGIFLLAACD